LGSQALTDSELLAIFIGTGSKDKNAVEIARELIAQQGSLIKTLDLQQRQFCRIPHMGPAIYAKLQAALAIGRRYCRASLDGQDVLSNPEQTKQYLASQLMGLDHEAFGCLFLNTRNELIAFEKLFTGTVDHAHVYPREVIKKALEYRCSGVILAHNHPSGNSNPSQSDCDLTQQLQHALSYVELRLLDHIIVSRRDILSFAEKGLLTLS
jgi:DNA repair protein RadC